jgi:hypothetical protein
MNQQLTIVFVVNKIRYDNGSEVVAVLYIYNLGDLRDSVWTRLDCVLYTKQ